MAHLICPSLILSVYFYINKRPFASDTIRVVTSLRRSIASRCYINQYICESVSFLETWSLIIIPTVWVRLYGLGFKFSFRLRFLHLNLIRFFCSNVVDRLVCTRLWSELAWRHLVVCWDFWHLFELLSLGCSRYSNGHLFVDWALEVSVIDWVICYTTDNAFWLKSWFHCSIIFVFFFRYGGLIIWSFIDSEVVWVRFVTIGNVIRVCLNRLLNLVSSFAFNLWLLFLLFELALYLEWWWTFSFLLFIYTNHL